MADCEAGVSGAGADAGVHDLDDPDPLLMGGFVFGSAFLTKKTRSTSHLVVVTTDTQLAFDLQERLSKGKTAT